MIQVLNSRVLVSGFLLLVLWLGVFYENILAMEAIWRRSDTFAHGYFVLPIVIWLFWRDRSYLLNSNFTTSKTAIPFLLGSLLLNLFAYTTDINVLGQLSAVFALISIVWLVLGNKLTWHYKFPLAYLIFLVPMGENLIPELQDITAWFTVEFLKLHGIPVFRDGLYIQIPNGLFEVAVACSGIRYLIASMAVGTLFAYLSFNSFKKQLLFFIFALVLPIVANGIRAYLIVIIAHYSDMEYATGADHLVYGWVFFGFIIMLMFWIGGKFSDPEVSAKQSAILAKKELTSGHFSIISISTGMVFCIAILLMKQNIPLVSAPLKPDSMTIQLRTLANSNWGIQFNNPLLLSHGTTNNNIEVYLAKYGNLQDRGELISFENKLHDEDSWTVIERSSVVIKEKNFIFIGLRSITGKTRSYLYRFRIGKFSTGYSLQAKLFQGWNTMTRQSDYSYIEAISLSTDITFADAKKILANEYIKSGLEIGYE